MTVSHITRSVGANISTRVTCHHERDQGPHVRARHVSAVGHRWQTRHVTMGHVITCHVSRQGHSGRLHVGRHPDHVSPDLRVPQVPHRQYSPLIGWLTAILTSAWKRSIRRFVSTEKAPTRAFSWLKAATTAFTFKTLLRHYAKWALTPRSLNVKLGLRLSVLNVKAVVAAFNQEKALVGAFSVITNLRMELFQALHATLFRR